MGNLRLIPGSLFANRFEIDKLAGSGGMGTVYRARDRYSGEVVALKLLHANGTGPDEGERFAREAELLSELSHPGIVAHVSHGQTPDGQRFLAMEWLDGLDLGQRLERGPLQLRDCLILFDHVSDALSLAHQRGIIHRDLKPTNLFLCGGDVSRVKILDFGIARRIATSHAESSGPAANRRLPTMTRTGMVIGTPEYMSPEQARGNRDLSPAVDLFSLGCVLYECLTGQPPFVADHVAAVLVRILFEEPAPIEERRPGIPTSLVTLLGRLLAKDPRQRLGDAAALRAELLALGELPEPTLALTLASPKPKAQSFAEQEQSLFSIVLAAADEKEIGFGATQPGSALPLSGVDRQALLHQTLMGLGVSADFLANGTLVVTAPPMGSAQDQATQAARAALLVKDRWPESVVVMATGRGVIRGRSAFGEVVELAARSLQLGLDPSQSRGTSGVLADALSAKLLEGRFALKPHPGGALLLHEEREVDASRPLLGKPTPCVGRDAELGNLEGLLNSCIEESEARVMLITAPPGIGKSRLRHEFLRRVEKRNEPVTVLLGRGNMMSAGAPYGILVIAIRRLCGIADGDPIDSQRQHLRARIAQHIRPADQDRIVLFVSELCNIQFPEEGRPMLEAARRDPKIMRDCLRNALLDWLAAECSFAPVLLILDDLQWGDALTVSDLDEALRAQAGAPLFVLAFARPEIRQMFPKLWQSHNAQELQLKGLGRKARERLIQQVLGQDVAPNLLAYAVEQSAGNALFLEEIIRSIAEGKLEDQPATVLAMLQARIGRLEVGARRAIRAASVFGQSFFAGGVVAILGLSHASPEVESWLTALSHAELIQPHAKAGLADQKAYGFRHALVRDAAYSLLTDNDLMTGHRLAAEFLERVGSEDLVVIAEHYHRGGDCARALPFFIRSAQQSYERYDLAEMQRRADRGVACGAQGEPLGILRALQFHAATGSADWPRALTLGAEALDLLTAGSLSFCRLIGVWGSILCFTGQVDRAVATARSFIDIEPVSEARISYLYAAMYFAILFCQGGLRAAATMVLKRMEQVASTAEEGDIHIRAPMQFSRATYLRSFQPDPWHQIVAAQEAAAAYRQIGNLREACICEHLVGEVQAEAGDWASGEASLRESAALAIRLNQPNLITAGQLHLASALARTQEPRILLEAEELLKKVFAVPGLSVGFRGWAHGVQARIFFMQGRHAEAELEARRSIELSRIAPLRRLLSLITLVYILLQQDRPDEARALAEEGFQQAESMGGAGYSELPLHLAVAEARHATGDPQGAIATLYAANNELNRRAALIPDLAARMQYLTNIPEHARITALTRLWGEG